VLSKENLAVDGIAILGHWHNVNLLNGWALVEANNAFNRKKTSDPKLRISEAN
jgi:hypothetical protein